jgi:hypothetical protein
MGSRQLCRPRLVGRLAVHREATALRSVWPQGEFGQAFAQLSVGQQAELNPRLTGQLSVLRVSLNPEHDTSSLSDLTLSCCGKAGFGHFLRSFSLNRMTIRLKRAQKTASVRSFPHYERSIRQAASASLLHLSQKHQLDEQFFRLAVSTDDGHTRAMAMAMAMAMAAALKIKYRLLENGEISHNSGFRCLLPVAKC